MRGLRPWLAGVMVLLACVTAQAMDIRPCSSPVVFDKAAVNALVLPWRLQQPGDAPTPAALQSASRQISSLAHLQLLFGMLPYGSVGAIDLVAEPGQVCDVDQVLSLVSQQGVQTGRLRPGQAALALWGRLFEQDGELFLQTYLRFARQGQNGLQPERMALDWGGMTLQAQLPMQALAFAPRRISLADLGRIDTAFREALRVRPKPDLNAPGVAIGNSPTQSFPYWITDTQGDWIKLAPMRDGLPSGWVRARSYDGTSDWSLARWLPELDYAQAVAGWLRLQAGGLTPADQDRIRQAVDAGLSRYERAVPADQAPTAWGLAAALRGQMLWSRGGQADAVPLFTRASELLPGVGPALSLQAMAGLVGHPADARAAHALEQALLAALALNPDDAAARANLVALYRMYAKQPAWNPYSAQALAARQAVLQAR